MGQPLSLHTRHHVRHLHYMCRRIREVQWWEIGVRFAFGGSISVIAAVLDHTFGHKLGGALLAFPAILPASLTLVDQKEGRCAAMRHVWGAYFGGLGMAAFALVIAWLAPVASGWSIPAGLAAWAVVSFGLFEFRSRTGPESSRRRPRRSGGS